MSETRKKYNSQKKGKPFSKEKQVTRKEHFSKNGAKKNVTELGKKYSWDACPYAKKCGGCDYQGIAYEKQLLKKQELVKELVGKFGKVNPILGMKNPLHYRNKVHAVFDIERRGARGNNKGRGGVSAGTIISGVYKAGTHDVINIDSCMIEDQKADAIIRDIRGLLRSFKINLDHMLPSLIIFSFCTEFSITQPYKQYN